MTTLRLAPLLSLLLLCSCAGKPEGEPVESLVRYRHSEDWMWRQVGQELDEQWALAEADRTKKEFVTAWRTNLAPVSYQGRRDRLRVTIAGDLEAGYSVLATQETEVNEELNDPLAESEAEWAPTASDNGHAVRFIRSLDARLRPRPAFEEEDVR